MTIFSSTGYRNTKAHTLKNKKKKRKEKKSIVDCLLLVEGEFLSCWTILCAQYSFRVYLACVQLFLKYNSNFEPPY